MGTVLSAVSMIHTVSLLLLVGVSFAAAAPLLGLHHGYHGYPLLGYPYSRHGDENNDGLLDKFDDNRDGIPDNLKHGHFAPHGFFGHGFGHAGLLHHGVGLKAGFLPHFPAFGFGFAPVKAV